MYAAFVITSELLIDTTRPSSNKNHSSFNLAYLVKSNFCLKIKRGEKTRGKKARGEKARGEKARGEKARGEKARGQKVRG
jgi:hypothetical protein